MKLGEFAGCRVAVWGLGREGRAALTVLARRFPGIECLVLSDTDVTTAELAGVPEGVDVTIRSGPEVASALDEADIVVTSPGVSLYRPEILGAAERGVRFTTGTRIWLAENPSANVVAVTGTKGKSTTASLIAHMLAFAGRNAVLAGNIGTPLLELAVEPQPGEDRAAEVFVVEVSSYQTCNLTADVPVAVLLNLYPEHLDWHGDVDTYYRDKLSLFEHQHTGLAVINGTDSVTARFRHLLHRSVDFNDPDALHVSGAAIRDGRLPLLDVADVPLQGAHNLSNVCAALTAVRAVGLEPDRCVDAVRTFEGLPHRLSVLGELDGVTWVDDSISTTPQSAIAATEAMSGRPITLLVGGYDRGQPLDDLAHAVARGAAARLIAMPASGPRIVEALGRAMSESDAEVAIDIREAGSLDEAVAIARDVTARGGVVLLSPAAPSYGAFRDYRERGDAFAAAAGFTRPGNA